MQNENSTYYGGGQRRYFSIVVSAASGRETFSKCTADVQPQAFLKYQEFSGWILCIIVELLTTGHILLFSKPIHVRKLEKCIQDGDQLGFCKYLKGMDVEGKICSSQCTRDDNGEMLKYVELIQARWVQWFYTLLNPMSPNLNISVIDDLPTRPIYEWLGCVPSMYETEEAVKSMANGNTVSTNELPAELSKLLLDDAGLSSLHDIIKGTWRRGRVP